jgi:hypothetical protein
MDSLTDRCGRAPLPHCEQAGTLQNGKLKLACPFFVPTSKCEDIAWLHPSRLPLGGGWNGHCGAPGHEGFSPTREEIKEFCNLGYAAACPRLPVIRAYDAVRFAVVRHSDSCLVVSFVFESQHRPAGHGTLEYAIAPRQWRLTHSDERIQRMAECYVQSYLSRKIVPDDASAGNTAD